MNSNTKKLCKIICALCLGLPLAYFLLVGNFTLAAVSGITIQLLFCGVMMFMMMKMMGCNDKKDKGHEESHTAEDNNQNKD
ncbi:DUF2933 domain-containing protein [Photobacterium makurazakiensis]|uniref:DUF2933 domain-containing protein n=1 Tax=Photobacterium makurazakiensis TaxID=2910234 RepID=UPI003D134604